MTKLPNEVRRTLEAKLDELGPPQIRTDESPLSPNNVIIHARTKLLHACVEITTNYDLVEVVDKKVRDAYLHQILSLVKSGILTLGNCAVNEGNDDDADLYALCLELLGKIERSY